MQHLVGCQTRVARSTPLMRLRPHHIEILKRLTVEQFGPAAKSILFTSRLEDMTRGGDWVR